MDIATLGAGCFWCIEALLLNVPGVTSVDVGYSGGYIDNPTYKNSLLQFIKSFFNRLTCGSGTIGIEAFSFFVG